jgi:hypothetical protein
LAEGVFGPPAPRPWSWRPPRKDAAPRSGRPGEQREGGERPPSQGNAFSGLADLFG